MAAKKETLRSARATNFLQNVIYSKSITFFFLLQKYSNQFFVDVISTVPSHDRTSAKPLQRCYTSCLNMMVKNNLRSIVRSLCPNIQFYLNAGIPLHWHWCLQVPEKWGLRGGVEDGEEVLGEQGGPGGQGHLLPLLGWRCPTLHRKNADHVPMSMIFSFWENIGNLYWQKFISWKSACN